MSRILSRISMLTGQISSHALHDVQAHTSSGVMRSNTEFDETVISGSRSIGGEPGVARRAAMTSPTLSTISRGSSGLPVACAGQTLVHRPHIVQASVSSSCFQVKSSTVDAPNDSKLGLHQVRHRLHRALGPVPVAQVHVQRRREHVAHHRDRQDGQEDDERERRGRSTRPDGRRTGAADRRSARRSGTR